MYELGEKRLKGFTSLKLNTVPKGNDAHVQSSTFIDRYDHFCQNP